MNENSNREFPGSKSARTARSSARSIFLLSIAAALLAPAVQAAPFTFSNTGSLATAREGHTATLLASGKVLVEGGYNGSVLASAELYDPATGTWSATGNLGAARYNHTATLLANGNVLVTGGAHTFNGSALASAELFDPASGTWTLTGSLGTARYFHTATLLPNGKVLVAGGLNGGGSLGSAELYDPANGTWTCDRQPRHRTLFSHRDIAAQRQGARRRRL